MEGVSYLLGEWLECSRGFDFRRCVWVRYVCSFVEVFGVGVDGNLF